MSFLTALNQKCTYWAQTGLDTYGKPTFAAPVVRDCRWEDRSETIMSKRGLEIVSQSRVFFGQDIALEGYLYLGESVAADPTALAGAHEIMQRKMIPDLRNLKQLYAAFL